MVQSDEKHYICKQEMIRRKWYKVMRNTIFAKKRKEERNGTKG